MPEFKGAWHRGKTRVVKTHCANRMKERKIHVYTHTHTHDTLRPKVTEGLKEIL